MNSKVMAPLARAVVIASLGVPLVISGSAGAAMQYPGVGGAGMLGPYPMPSSAINAYQVTVLTTDTHQVGLNLDSKLVNPWGLAHAGGGPWLVADNGTASATLLSGDGTPLSLVINVPGSPTGVVFNAGPLTLTKNAGIAGSPVFVFASEDGTISGWNPLVNKTQASVLVTSPGAAYKGVAMARTLTGELFYATDFHDGRVDVFDGAFKPVSLSGGFVDPNLPAGYAPFGIANIAGRIFVTFAQQDSNKEDDVPGPGFGYVDAFDLNGKFLVRVASAGSLNAPWGLARAPANFGKFGGALLVGNFGDGRITAFGLTDDTLGVQELGQLENSEGNPISIDGLWGIAFGNQGEAGFSNVLYFTAGPNGEKDGQFGSIRPE